MYPIWLVEWAGELQRGKVLLEAESPDAPACQTGAGYSLVSHVLCEGPPSIPGHYPDCHGSTRFRFRRSIQEESVEGPYVRVWEYAQL